MEAWLQNEVSWEEIDAASGDHQLEKRSDERRGKRQIIQHSKYDETKESLSPFCANICPLGAIGMEHAHCNFIYYLLTKIAWEENGHREEYETDFFFFSI